MNFYKLKLKNNPKQWEKYSIMDANPDLETFKWFLALTIKANKMLKDHNGNALPATVIIETTDENIMMFAIAHGEEYNLQRMSASEFESIKHKQQADDFLQKWRDKQRNQNEGTYDGYYGG